MNAAAASGICSLHYSLDVELVTRIWQKTWLAALALVLLCSLDFGTSAVNGTIFAAVWQTMEGKEVLRLTVRSCMAHEIVNRLCYKPGSKQRSQSVLPGMKEGEQMRWKSSRSNV